MRRIWMLVTLLVTEIAFVAGLHALGGAAGLSTDALLHAGAPVDDALMAAVRLVALATAWWLLGSTLLYMFGLLLRVPMAVRAAGALTFPAVRKVVERSMAATLSVSLVAGGATLRAAPAVAESLPVAAVSAPVVEDGVVVPGPAASALAAMRTGPGAGGADGGAVRPGVGDGWLGRAGARGDGAAKAADDGEPAAPAPPAAGGRHTVRAGEHLWAIAVAAVARAEGMAPEAVPDAAVAAYWRRLVASFVASAPGRDPDLVHPGEVVRLPDR